MKFDSGTDQLIATASNGVATIVLNNPSRRNALSCSMMSGIVDVLERIHAEGSTRVVVIRGAGGRAFAAGADLNVFAAEGVDADDRGSIETAYSDMLTAVRGATMPTIALIEGACLGGGLELALAADLRYAAKSSTLGIPAARIGLAFPGVEPLASLVGSARAAELLFTARRINGTEAFEFGLVNRAVEDESLHQLVAEIAGAIAENAPLAVKSTKLALRELRNCAADRDMHMLEESARACMNSDDFTEGRTAFFERRAPHFAGR
ncbi:enoyl-CoA hydratase-related protein [Rhodococcus globerulus]|uniref:Enoyl-CoA hydratase-related protein n=1 Tax=Rhodococcus globerulus TaxID=33008 RepID=A0ABU4C3Z7_RHOGO|nr:enoyl-CoA hydratase-related protein [Rhodococcus globerulus]MDV6271144.1 enoyl-CoA hydratase-related protein [Rhodococcus globerulus]